MPKKVRILVVEDNPADVELLRWALECAALDYELTVIGDGTAALEFAQQQGKYADAPIPDLALLDLNLPRHSGLEVLQALRANRAFAKMPVAIVSSSTLSRERKNLEPYGVGRFITKPSELDEFLRIGLSVKELLVETKLRETLFGKRKSLPTTL